ncbi:hypothetical protein [Roseococcus pinisoli]|uniref:Uncharacterized protein n=1 Tax=Roseococcus pinisoli TaxID=2835040 RepID=A0ABS5QAI2_9PROT|nr:hypothetical protein [Roseococcus pinisoli]MBS7810512.1 hypothetical protein [Roseococcus pinisoli]
MADVEARLDAIEAKLGRALEWMEFLAKRAGLPQMEDAAHVRPEFTERQLIIALLTAVGQIHERTTGEIMRIRIPTGAGGRLSFSSDGSYVPSRD